MSITGEWQSWQGKVPQIEVETHKVASPDVVVPTLDTVRHEALLYTWLAEHKPLVLCGPPGSGKTMTLFSALRALPDMEVRKFCVFKCKNNKGNDRLIMGNQLEMRESFFHQTGVKLATMQVSMLVCVLSPKEL